MHTPQEQGSDQWKSNSRNVAATQPDAESLKFALPLMKLRSSIAAGKRAQVEIAGVEAVTGRSKTGRAFFLNH
jgi:hypothetical protein